MTRLTPALEHTLDCVAGKLYLIQRFTHSSKRQAKTTSFLDGDVTAGRCSPLLDQQRKDDHLHSGFGDLVAVDQALAAGDGFPN